MALGKTIAFLGAGNMAEALVKGMLRAHVAEPAEIVCSDRAEERGPELIERYGIQFTTSNLEAVQRADIIVLSVKPQIMNKLLDEVAPALNDRKLVISIAAGVPIAAIERKVGHGVRIVRTMPNTPALVGAGATALSPGEHATPDDLRQARMLFDAVGKTVVVDEPLLDAVTGLSGSGPAYIFLVIEALSDAGVKVGLARVTAQELAAQTVLGFREAPHRDQGAPGPAQGSGDEPRRHGHRRPPHAGGRRAPNHPDGRRRGRYEALARARRQVPRDGRVAEDRVNHRHPPQTASTVLAAEIATATLPRGVRALQTHATSAAANRSGTSRRRLSTAAGPAKRTTSSTRASPRAIGTIRRPRSNGGSGRPVAIAASASPRTRSSFDQSVRKATIPFGSITCAAFELAPSARWKVPSRSSTAMVQGIPSRSRSIRAWRSFQSIVRGWRMRSPGCASRT